MGHKVSTKRSDGRNEYPAVTTRGQVKIGIIFYLLKKENVSVMAFEKILTSVSDDIKWGEPVINENEDRMTIFFPVQFLDEELETAGNESKADYLKKLEEMTPGIESLKTKLAAIINSFQDLPEGLEAVEYIGDTHSTLT